VESEQGVERSIRDSTILESLLTNVKKRFRSDIAATSPKARDAASTSNPKLALEFGTWRSCEY
jgi:hypothetical protein